MATAWYMIYNDGSAKTLSFTEEEAESCRILNNCNEDVQAFKSGLSVVYSGPYIWRTVILSFRLIAGSLTRIRTLAAVRVPVCIYYHYHRVNTDKIWGYIVPKKDEQYSAGHLMAGNIELEFVETTEPS